MKHKTVLTKTLLVLACSLLLCSCGAKATDEPYSVPTGAAENNTPTPTNEAPNPDTGDNDDNGNTGDIDDNENNDNPNDNGNTVPDDKENGSDIEDSVKPALSILIDEENKWIDISIENEKIDWTDPLRSPEIIIEFGIYDPVLDIFSLGGEHTVCFSARHEKIDWLTGNLMENGNVFTLPANSPEYHIHVCEGSKYRFSGIVPLDSFASVCNYYCVSFYYFDTLEGGVLEEGYLADVLTKQEAPAEAFANSADTSLSMELCADGSMIIRMQESALADGQTLLLLYSSQDDYYLEKPYLELYINGPNYEGPYEYYVRGNLIDNNQGISIPFDDAETIYHKFPNASFNGTFSLLLDDARISKLMTDDGIIRIVSQPDKDTAMGLVVKSADAKASSYGHTTLAKLPEKYRSEDDDEFFEPTGPYYKVMAIELPQIVAWEDGKWAWFNTIHGRFYGYLTDTFCITNARVVYLDSYDEFGKLINSVVKVEYEDRRARNHAMLGFTYIPESYGFDTYDTSEESFEKALASTLNMKDAEFHHMNTRTIYYTLPKNIQEGKAQDYFITVANLDCIRVFLHFYHNDLWQYFDESDKYSGITTYDIDYSRGQYCPPEIKDPSGIEAKMYGEMYMPD